MIKTIFKLTVTTLLTLNFALSTVKAQAPQNFKYQAIVRNSTGAILENQQIGFQLSILQTNETGTSVYTETFTTTTNSYGLVNLLVGEGTVVNGDFTSIDWGTDEYFLKVELDETGGSNYVLLGTSKLSSVPYALHASSAANVFSGNYNDLSNTPSIPTNTSDLTNDSGFITNPDDNDADPTNELQVLNFSNDTLYLSDGGQIFLGNYNNLWNAHGNDIYNTNTRNVGVGLENPEGKLVVQGDSAVSDTLPLFEVKNKDGITIFAVYDGGIRMYVSDDPAKNNNDKGGFAIGGYRLDKSITNEYMRVTPDSVRIYIKEENTNKNNNDKGGFAIGGYRLDKTTPEEYLNVYAADTAYIIDTTAQMLWYPLKEAFLSGKILVEDGDSVGQNSWATGYVSKSIGNYSQALGYQARAFGNNSTAIGYYANSIGSNSYSFGNYATAKDSGSYAIGSGAKATGLRSFAFGSTGIDSANIATNPTKASGDYAYAFGMGSIATNEGSFAFGSQDTCSGAFSLSMGTKSMVDGYHSTAIGYLAKTNGDYSTAIGYGAVASGEYSVSIGTKTVAENKSFAGGYYTIASGEYSFTNGFRTRAEGFSSFAMGRETIASGSKSVALGSRTTASGNSSVALGGGTVASNYYSFASGFNSIASGSKSTAMGNNTIANGASSTALGVYTEASGVTSTVFGSYSKASGTISTAMGNRNIASGHTATVMGYYNIARSKLETVIGQYNDTTNSLNQSSWVDTEPLFAIGNGSDNANRHNAVTVLKNGNVGIGTLTPDYKLQVNGDVVPVNNKVYDLGTASLAWDNIYYDDLHNQGAAAFNDRKVTDEILLFPPKGKVKGMIDYKTERGLVELDPNSLPKALTGGTFWILTDEMATYNYKANYEQQLQIKQLQKDNNKLQNNLLKQTKIDTKLQNDINTLKREIEQLKQIIKLKSQK